MKQFILVMFLFCLQVQQSMSMILKKDYTEKSCVTRDGASIFYEVYGDGPPVLLLHGGLYGNIREFESIIPQLRSNFKVIAVATRGHGRSDIGNLAYSFGLFAEDAATVLKNETDEPAIVIGFSDGATTAIVLAARYKGMVKKVAALGGGLGAQGYRRRAKRRLDRLAPADVEKQHPEFVASRKKRMREPGRWNEFVERMKAAWLEDRYLELKESQQIACPVLILCAEKDVYRAPERYVEMIREIPKASLAIIPRAAHLDLISDQTIFKEYVLPFVLYRDV